MNMTREERIDRLEERWGDLECKLIQCSEGTPEHTSIKLKMEIINKQIAAI